MASELMPLLAPQPAALVIAVVADLAIGDPIYRLQPLNIGRPFNGNG